MIGNLYLDIPDKGIVNLVDELNTWPIFLEKNIKHYVASWFTSYFSLLIKKFIQINYSVGLKYSS